MAGMPNRKRFLAAVFVPLLVGSIALGNLSHQPRFALFRNVDLLTLIAAGMCFGAALTTFIRNLRDPRTLQRAD